MYLSADFPEKQSTTNALARLQANGFTPGDIAVFSEEPIEFPDGVLVRKSRMSLVVVAAGITACLLTIVFVYYTQYNYPLVTGGMPIFSPWATGVIFYELTLLGAILTTFVWFLRESGLPKRKRKEPVPIVEPGTICVRVRCRPDQVDRATRNMREAGAVNVKELGDAA